jgi:hypothetical protein
VAFPQRSLKAAPLLKYPLTHFIGPLASSYNSFLQNSRPIFFARFRGLDLRRGKLHTLEKQNYVILLSQKVTDFVLTTASVILVSN